MRINGKKVVAVKRNGREFVRVARGGVDLWTSNALPSGFTALEYVQSSGEQYVDTGFKCNQDTKVVADMLIVSNNASLAANEFFGARTSTSSKAYALQYNANKSNLQLFYGGGYTEQSESLPTERAVYELDRGTVTYNGKSIVRDYTTFQCDYSMYIFALNNAGSVAFQSIARLYSCQIYDNGTLVRNFAPCMNASNVCGLYDRVNKVFYPSASSTALLPPDGTV